MKNKILSLLKPKFEGVSDAVLERIAVAKAKTLVGKTDEEIEAAIAAITIQNILDSYGDSRANEAAASAVKNYEVKHGLKDGKKADDDPKTPIEGAKDQSDLTPEMKAMQESISTLTNMVKSLTQEKIANSRKEQLNDVVKNLPDYLQSPYKRMSFDSLSDEEFSNQLQSITTEVNEISSKMKASGAVFSAPLGGGAKGDPKEEVPAALKQAFEAAKSNETQNF